MKHALSELEQIKKELRMHVRPEKRAVLRRFFKTGPGEYAEGDKFLGVMVPQTREVARAHRRTATFADARALLASEFHEERLLALLLLIEQYRAGTPAMQQKIYDLYLSQTARINNWDLVDLSAEHIVGAYLASHASAVEKSAALYHLAQSLLLWDRRIAMLSTFHDIKRGDPRAALEVARLLVHDKHDLIHKAVGWMLREIGEKCSRADEEKFLRVHAATMPRTMLRYAIEKFTPAERAAYLTLRTNSPTIQP